MSRTESAHAAAAAAAAQSAVRSPDSGKTDTSVKKDTPKLSRPVVYLDVSIEEEHVGRLEITLFADLAPRACENLRALCTGERGVGSKGKPLHLKGTKIHRIIPNFMLQAGDITQGDGTGGDTIYQGARIQPECLIGRHTRLGVVSAARSAAEGIDSQFFITLAPAPWCDETHVVLGIVRNLNHGARRVLRAIEACGTEVWVDPSRSGQPRRSVVISDCGQLA